VGAVCLNRSYGRVGVLAHQIFSEDVVGEYTHPTKNCVAKSCANRPRSFIAGSVLHPQWLSRANAAFAIRISAMTAAEQTLKTALQLHHAGRLIEAERGYRDVLSMQPGHIEATHMLGVIALNFGRHDEAAELIGVALKANPADPTAHCNMAIALRAQGKFDESIAACREALRCKPALAEAYINLGLTFMEQGRTAEAVEAYHQAIRLQPGEARIYSCLGDALSEAGKLQESIAVHRQAIGIAPNLAGAHLKLGQALLLSGDFSGWAEYEWRWKFEYFPSRSPKFQRPQWSGESLNGRTVLLHAEQGFGDTIQFVRYAGMVAARGGKVILECSAKLCTLLKQLPGIEMVLAAGQTLPPFDLQCPLMSLPFAFGTQPESIPNIVPYLRADPQRAKDWAARLPAKGRDLRVGLAWAGSAGSVNDRQRSIDPLHFLPLAAVKGVRFVSLQKERRATQSDPPPELRLIDHAAELQDFADTAALIKNLDLVISADTAVAHLAGAMGKLTCVLLPFAPDWRWQLNRSDSPWYPNMRLFRQPAFGDWESAFREVTKSLTAATQSRLKTRKPG
jgi:tetratricopeptide (TPR) repeat protein